MTLAHATETGAADLHSAGGHLAEGRNGKAQIRTSRYINKRQKAVEQFGERVKSGGEIRRSYPGF